MRYKGQIILARNEFKRHILLKKICATVIIIGIYILGRSIPLYGVDTSEIMGAGFDAETILKQTIGGDLYQNSIFAIGISPYFTASILMMFIRLLKSKASQSKTSQKRINRITIELTLLLGGYQAYQRVETLKILEGYNELLVKIVCFTSMLTGVIVVLILCERNIKYGIGKQSCIFFINIVTGFATTISKGTADTLTVPLLIGFAAMAVAFFMELRQKKIEVLRISIHNIYADKNYMALKYNPIGIMPIMFATAFFSLAQIIESGVHFIWPQSSKINWLIQNTTMKHLFGVCLYIAIIYFLTIFFARIMINPKDVSEQYLKSGDCLEGIHPGKPTRKYLSKVVFIMSFASATVLSICVGIPLFMQIFGSIDAELAMLPTSIMMLTGLICGIGQEAYATVKDDSYSPIF